MLGAIPPLPQYVFMAWCLVKHRDNFTFTFSNIWRSVQVMKLLVMQSSLVPPPCPFPPNFTTQHNESFLSYKEKCVTNKFESANIF
jgi:hypothetical protein